MQFSEMIFVGGFLPLFLVFSFIGSIRKKAADSSFLQRENKRENGIFLFFSLLFLSSQGLISLLILTALMLYSFAIGKRIHEKSKRYFAFSILILLLPLLFFKYSIYFSSLPLWLKGFMPFGISFYTFRFISYLSDCRKEGNAEESLFHFALYAFAFPVLSQGPILRYKDMREEILAREWNFTRLSRALFRFSFGLWKKLILADALGQLSNSFLSPEEANGLSGGVLPSFIAVFFSGLSFMLQIYRDFWRRWHISLSLFFRDYIYIPLGGNRLSFGRRVLNLLLIWILTGIWHGASFNFILWGLYFFVLIVLELMGKKVIAFGKARCAVGKPKKILRFLAGLKTPILHVYTLLVIYISWIFFRYRDFSAIKNVLKAHLFRNVQAFSDEKSLLLLRNHIFLFLLAVLFSSSFFKRLDTAWADLMMRGRIRKERKGKKEEEGFYGMEENDEEVESKGTELLSEEEHKRHILALKKIQRKTKWKIFLLDHGEHIYYLFKILLALAALAISFSAMVGQSYTPFLYNQF